MKPPVAILHAPGTNRDLDIALALEVAGAAPEIVHINRLLACERRLSDYAMLVIPGGFSYGDDLGAGKLWAVRLRHDLGAQIDAFARSGKPILGICNGFQVLVKTGLLPDPAAGVQSLTLTRNTSARFECRWVYLEPNRQNPSPWLRGLERIFCPVAHGEGNFQVDEAGTLQRLQRNHQIAFTYVDSGGQPGPYPVNPNGSVADIAGITDPQGHILGLMPHPENHILPHQHPGFHRSCRLGSGLRLFQNGVAMIR
ncbi:MAG: phosphoribosylformylglycinamidine synthase I [Caldilineae bacterium]|nr:MAG: phosphoribosylformylglycinamidine synthase I [Caldilineae bacterium]